MFWVGGRSLVRRWFGAKQRDIHTLDHAKPECLPADILTVIFECVQIKTDPKDAGPAMPLESQSLLTSTRRTWIYVSHVCRSWRQAALDCPTLWSCITPVQSYEEVETYLTRSKQASLSVHLRGNEDGAAKKIILQQLPRIRTLLITPSDDRLKNDKTLTPLWNQPMSRLESLVFFKIQVSSTDFDHEQPTSQVELNFDSLPLDLHRRVLMQWPNAVEDIGYALHLVPSAIAGTPWVNVTFFYLHFVSSFATHVCERDWVEFFDSMPKLEELVISLNFCPNGNPDVGLPQALTSRLTIPTTYRCPELRYLELEGCRLADKIDCYVKCFASRFETVPLEKLGLTNCTPITTDELVLLEKYVEIVRVQNKPVGGPPSLDL
ncbi:hypothetical protein BD410DRAFT_837356 [Rickenella mellea]|uniref:Uncharacterized protein n=1 Tax=Rickenella mellea TaxID=50990 RepID=A0A4Y7QE12_9AGAM|nr:hypothetical protein BD410DRAFT_837356 [Rickenella mellea]